MFWNGQAYRYLAVLDLAFVGGRIAMHATLQWRDCTDQIISYPPHRARYSLILNFGLKCSYLPADIQQAALPLFILGVENTPLPKCIVVGVYINTSMIMSMKIIPGAKIASLGMKCKLLKLRPFLMFQQAWLFFAHCRARCFFLLSEETKANHSAQGAAWALGTYGCHESMLYNEKTSDAKEQRNAGGKETASQGLEEGVLPFLCRP